MLRNAVFRVQNVVGSSLKAGATSRQLSTTPIVLSKHSTETDEQFDARYENFFNRKDIDGWDVRRGFHDLLGHDLVPEPKIISAALKACRRVNDYAMAVRILESVKDKCGGKVNEIYPYIIQEIRPTLTELGISTPEEMGYDKPELFCQSVYNIH